MNDVHNPQEIWKPVIGFPSYAVSSLGRVKRVLPDSYGRSLAHFLNPVPRKDGYISFSLHHCGKQSVKLGHRIVCEAFYGPAPAGRPYACHNDGNKANNVLSNLRWDSPSNNNLDKNAHGTMPKGEGHKAVSDGSYLPRGVSHKMAKLTDACVLSIRKDNRPQAKIADDYGVSQSLISAVKSKKIWKHIKETPND